MDRSEFLKGIGILGGTLGCPATPAQLEGYWIALQDLDPASWERAIGTALRTHKLKCLPVPGELRAWAGVVEETAADKAALAWPVVVEAIQRHGAYRSVAFDDPLIAAAIRQIGGWQWLCSREGDDFSTWARKAFCDAYAAFSRTGFLPAGWAEPLPGICERSNGVRFGAQAEPERIGAPMCNALAPRGRPS